MRLVFTPLGWEDYLFWQSHDKAMLKRLNLFWKIRCVIQLKVSANPNHSVMFWQDAGRAELMMNIASCIS